MEKIMSKTNAQIRAAAKDAGVYLWEVAEKYGVTDASFSRILRRELPTQERDKVLTIIKELSTEKAGDA